MNPHSTLKSVLTMILIFVTLVITYCYISGINEYKIAKKALESKDYENAVTHFARAIGWYVPFASYPDQSIAGFMDIAEYYEKKGMHDELMDLAYILKGALLSIRSTHKYDLGEKSLMVINDHLAMVNAKKIARERGERYYLPEKERQLKLITKADKRDTLWSSLAPVCFFGWVLFTVLLIFRLFENNVVNFNSNVIIIMIMITAFYVLWLISLIKA